jgi:hypothetical protein
VISKGAVVSPDRITTVSGTDTWEGSPEDRRTTRSEERLFGMETAPPWVRTPLSSEAGSGRIKVRAAAGAGKIACVKRIPRIKAINRIPERAVFVIGVEGKACSALSFEKNAQKR